MKLEEVEQLYKKKGIFFFKMVQFHLGNLSGTKDIFTTESNYVFQSHFLYLLEQPIPVEEVDRPEYLLPIEIPSEDKDPECQFAEDHFLMLVSADTHHQTPRKAIQHIKKCPACKKRLDQYHGIVLEPNKLNKEQAFCVKQIIARLVQHFSFLDKKVDCQTTRRFLPQLADTGLPILLPTPISVHVEQCPQCERNLSIIRHLELNSKQLAGLSQAYSETNAHRLKKLVDEIHFENIPPEKLKHIRETLYSISEDKESGVTTLYEVGETPEKLKAAKSRDLYAELCENYNAYMPKGWPGRRIAVGCNWAKSTVALVSREVPSVDDIPAPACAHIHRCEQCKRDVKTIQTLNLDQERTEALTKFYWKFRYVPEVPPLDQSESFALHEQSERITKSFAQMRFDKLSQEELEHICLCKKCRDLVYKMHQIMIDKLSKSTELLYPFCVRFRDIYFFDCSLPSHDRYTNIQSGIFKHFSSCPRCLEKVQRFHKTIYDIAEREESGVVVDYEFDPDAADKKDARDKAHLCDEWPITVQVFEHGQPKPRPKPIPELKRKPKPESEQRIDLAVTTCLEFHLSYRNRPVNCKVVKPFLPWQADEILAISEQTPITAHINKCLDCRNDMETLKQLNLDQKHLAQLSKLFAGNSHEDTGNCFETREAMQVVAEMNFSATAAKVLRHVCICPTCRQLLYEERKEMLESLPAYDLSPEFPCESISPSEIFVYTIPFGLDPANDQYAKFRPSFTSHLVKCPTCLEKMLELHNTIYTILERPNSGVITCFALAES